MSKNKKQKSSAKKDTNKKEKKALKTECCEKYIIKGESKRCKRCPCFDMPRSKRLQRFENLDIKTISKDENL